MSTRRCLSGGGRLWTAWTPPEAPRGLWSADPEHPGQAVRKQVGHDVVFPAGVAGNDGDDPRDIASAPRFVQRAMARALIIVDFQNDFTPGGALPVPDGDQISQRINELAASGEFDLVVATRDWHPSDHGSFAKQGGRWPEHCVAGSDGAQLHPSLEQQRADVITDKGQDR